MALGDPGFYGTNSDDSRNEDYCIYCFAGGEFNEELTMEEMIEDCAPRMAQNMDWSVDECASLLGAILPNLRRWSE